MRSKLSAWAWVVGVCAGGLGLLRLGELDGMAVDWERFPIWLTGTTLELVLAALARVAGLALVAWMALSTVGYAFARVAGAHRTALRWLSIPPLRRAVDALLAGSLLLNTMAPAVAAEAPGGSAPVQEMVHPAYVPVAAGPDQQPSPPTADGKSAVPHEEPDGPHTVVVEPGDNLWLIAERHLTEVWGRRPEDNETAPYWRKVIDANRRRIRSGDPDLIFPGEEIVLPEP